MPLPAVTAAGTMLPPAAAAAVTVRSPVQHRGLTLHPALAARPPRSTHQVLVEHNDAQHHLGGPELSRCAGLSSRAPNLLPAAAASVPQPTQRQHTVAATRAVSCCGSSRWRLSNRSML